MIHGHQSDYDFTCLRCVAGEPDECTIQPCGKGWLATYRDGSTSYLYRTQYGQIAHADGNAAYDAQYAYACGYRD